jgi:glycosyltransferase involved in cell wall biosynthesis
MAENKTKRDSASQSVRRPRVLYLLSDPGIPLYSSIKAGGVHSRAMIQAFVNEGADVEVIALRPGKGRDSLDESVRVHVAHRGSMRRRWNRAYRYRAAPLWATGIETLLAQRDFLKSARILAKSGQAPDLIYARHTWLPYALPGIQSRMKAPLFLEVNALFAEEKAERDELAFPRLTRRLERRTLGRAERILPVSGALAIQIEHLGLPAERIRMMPNGVDLTLFDPRLREKARAMENPLFTIGLASSFRHYHGIKTLLRAVNILEKKIGPVRLRLIGDGPMRSNLEGVAQQLNLVSDIELTGAVAHKDIPGFLSACDVCVAPYEGERNLYNCPMKLFEYMALKIPVVASRWGEIPKFLEHERTALLHEAADPESLALMLENVHADPEGARRRTEAAFEYVQGHTWRSHARWILDQAAIRNGKGR